MKYLFVKPQGGLANRIRVIEAAYNYAHVSNARLSIIWERNSILNAYFSTCFEQIKDVVIIEADYFGTSALSKMRRLLFDKIEDIGLAFFTQKNIFDVDIYSVLTNKQVTEKTKLFFDKEAESNKGIFIETCLEFYPNLFHCKLHIQYSIQRKAEHFLHNYSSLIGVHIRRTDHADAINSSPLDKFIIEMKAILKQSPDTNFYLSTDADDVIEELKQLFNDKIIVGATVRSRSSKEGIISALTDMYCLSRCTKIIGSYKSSFSERAAIIGNIPLQVII